MKSATLARVEQPEPAMTVETFHAAVSKLAVRTGRVLSGLGVAFLLFDGGIKFTKIPAVVESFGRLGYSPRLGPGIGLLELALVALYLVPRTSALGALLLTAFLGGATASQVRVGGPLFSHVLFPSYVAILLWGGLWLRDSRVRSLLPVRTRRAELERA